ncbi:BadF/BadG/BcrA/BcrD type ATPase [Anaerolineae bacterium CFX7]|nr:BadF/BadG/BcrA/BcrD type ATPase [Anaerolineae bacterium CFX7]
MIIGIDGGGTRTRAALADLDGTILARGEAGTSNPLTHGVAAAQRELETAVVRAFAQAGLPRTRADALCMGLGGASQAREQQALAAWARAQLAERVVVVHDGEIALAAGAPDNWGVAVIAGTGSLQWGRHRAGNTARAGGWGYLMGDEGSAYDMARQALRAATQSADGRGEKTELLAAILDFWKLAAPAELVAQVYRADMTPQALAQLAPVAARCAAQGDAVALRLFDDAADDLARGVAAVQRALGFEDAEFPLALTGGFLLGVELYREKFLRALTQRDCRCAPLALVHEPTLGAVRLARAMLFGGA